MTHADLPAGAAADPPLGGTSGARPLAVAALSARALAEAAAATGRPVLALDLFGDLDTRRVALQWWPAGDPAQLALEAAPLLHGLRAAAARGAQGWVAGSGFEADPALLEAGAAVLPLIGNGAAVMRRLADPRAFFALLALHGLPHPAVRFDRPPADELPQWLHKCSAGCGGWRVQPACQVGAGEPLAATACWQRRAPGRPVSVTFLADGRRARVLGFNQQRVQPLPGLPFAWSGIVGPVAMPPAAAAVLARAVDVLVAAHGLRGLGSVDALLDGDTLLLLELNARVPASLALYPRCGGLPTMEAHVKACLHGRLPPPGPADGSVRGTAVVYAPGPGVVDAALSHALVSRPATHDLPAPGTVLAAGDPLCSVSAQAASAADVHSQLDRACQQLQAQLALRLAGATVPLETCPP